MNGATALDCEKTISNPNSTKTTTIGTSQYFFSCRRNRQNSESTRPLLIQSSIHPRVVLPIAIARRIRRPAAVGAAAARERILAEQPPHDAERHEDDDEHQREEDAGVEVADDARAAPPPDARPRQQRGRRGAKHDPAIVPMVTIASGADTPFTIGTCSSASADTRAPSATSAARGSSAGGSRIESWAASASPMRAHTAGDATVVRRSPVCCGPKLVP